MGSHSQQDFSGTKGKAAEHCRTPKPCGMRMRRVHASAFWQFLLLLLVAFDLFAAAKKPAKMKAPPKIPPGKPEIFQLEPHGIQRGVAAKIKLIGTNLVGLTELKLHDDKLEGALLDDPPATTNGAWITL